MQTYTIRFETPNCQPQCLSISPDHTLYQLKKEASKIYQKSFLDFDIILNHCKLIDLTMKIADLSIQDNTVIEIADKQPLELFEQKIQLVVRWQGIPYYVSLSANSTVLDLKKKVTSMLGLEDNYSIKCGKDQLEIGDFAINYVFCNRLTLQKCNIQYFHRNVKLVQSVSSSEKQNHDLDYQLLNPGKSQTKKRQLNRHNSLRNVSQIEQQISQLKKLQKSEPQQHFQLVQSQKKLKNSLSLLARNLQSQAKETFSINSSADYQQQFKQVLVNFTNQQQSRLYTIQSLKQKPIKDLIKLLAKLQNCNIQDLTLYMEQDLFESRRQIDPDIILDQLIRNTARQIQIIFKFKLQADNL